MLLALVLSWKNAPHFTCSEILGGLSSEANCVNHCIAWQKDRVEGDFCGNFNSGLIKFGITPSD
jgi:hypothetical protein